MKGDVGMSLHEKEGEQEDAYIYRDKKSLITPSLHLCLFCDNNLVVCGYTGDAIWGQKLKCVQDFFIKNKDVGMGLSITSCLGIGIFLFPFFFMK